MNSIWELNKSLHSKHFNDAFHSPFSPKESNKDLSSKAITLDNIHMLST